MHEGHRDTRHSGTTATDGTATDGLVDSLRHSLAHRRPGLMGQEFYTRAAILLPLVRVEGRWHVLFEVRSLRLRHQPGDVCFPGGHVEPADEGPEAAAVRETCEELNLQPRQVQVLGPLDILVTPWGMILHPYVGVLQDVEDIRPAEGEIDRVFTVPLQEIREAHPARHWVEIRVIPGEDFPYDKIPGGRHYPWRHLKRPELFFEFGGQVVWGLTARVLDHFRRLVDSLEGTAREAP